ncbi:MAG: flagellar biosynthesis protein FlgE [Pseudomonadota bacterium]
MISSVINSGANGLQRSSQALNNAAQEIASVGAARKETSSTQDLIEPLIELKREQHIFNASAKVVQVGSDTLGSLLDIKA